ncbi:MAG: alpha/beta hydrolase, partial [Burkholderiaceae bacterium]|nr:alpha/beta hydrolase [Burkholderiaceae bacterium]
MRAAAAVLLLGACIGEAAALELAPCRLPGIAHEVRCGVVARPLDPARPDGTQVDVHVAVLPALARSRRP